MDLTTKSKRLFTEQGMRSNRFTYFADEKCDVCKTVGIFQDNFNRNFTWICENGCDRPGRSLPIELQTREDNVPEGR